MKSCQVSVSSGSNKMAIPEEDITVDTSACNRTVRHTAFNKLSKASYGGPNKQSTDSEKSSSLSQEGLIKNNFMNSRSSLLFKSRPHFQYVSSNKLQNNIESNDSIPEFDYSHKSAMQLKNIEGPRKASTCLSLSSSKAPLKFNNYESLSHLPVSLISSQIEISIAEYNVNDSILEASSSADMNIHQNYPKDARSEFGCEAALQKFQTSLEEIVGQGKPKLSLPGYNPVNNVFKDLEANCLKAKKLYDPSQKDHEVTLNVMVTQMPNEEGRKFRTFPKEQYKNSSNLSQQSQDESF